ncbi:cytochrome-c peroxidase [Mesorhizobium sp. ZC-5]|uniref:cytochrome-c peroxidase n=1 Tax=Mesorhizobium sp. ZC-5 TaxID=2986066 RepID=UPI0021E7E826|nr:cytochrome c peroxidase [Mesorhizobium sp. ZC-5]MCV3240844.1 methylamine utilization protein [Mesorhizobium sp. ZC-5]
MRRASRFVLGALAVSTLATAGCQPVSFSDAEKEVIASLALTALPPLPDDPTNRVADDPAAAALGATLFFDARMSSNGTVSCSSCHLIDRQFQDDLPLAKGIGTTNRRTMPLAGVAWSPWLFWDGRRDSLWAQALVPMENPVEHGGNRAAFAHFIAANFHDRYERIFGPLPDLSGVPENAGPLGSEAEKAAWNAMTDAQREAVDRVFSNIGKMIAAFERSIVPEETRFDRFAAALAAGKQPEGDAAFSSEEMLGLKLFIGKANCINCHNGARFTDNHFHNTGVPVVAGLPEDLGRETAVKDVAADPFNCLGKFSDAGPGDCGELRFMVTAGEALTRAYKAPSLRGAAGRPPYMHAGQIETLEAVLDHYATAPIAPSGASEVHPMTLSEREREALIAFLKTLGE